MRQLYIPDYVLSSDIPVIKENFEKLKLGKVRDICLEPHRECEYNVDNDLYSAAYLYMDYWYNTQEAEEFKNLIKTNKEAKMESDYKSWVFEFVEDDISELTQNYNNLESLTKYNLDSLNYYVNYLLNKDRDFEIKKYRKFKSKLRLTNNRKAQREWKNRLRPKNILKLTSKFKY